MIDDDNIPEDALFRTILEYFFNEEKQSSDVQIGRAIEACCQVLASFVALDRSVPTERAATEISRMFSLHRERFIEHYNENPLNRPDRFGHRPQ